MDVYGSLAGIGLSTGSQNVDKAASNGIELRAINRTLDDVEAGRIAGSIPFPREGTVKNAPQGGSNLQPGAKTSDLKPFLLSICITLPLASMFTAVGWAFRTLVLLDIPPFGSVSAWMQLKASAIGFAVVAPVAVVAFTTAIIGQVHRPHHLSNPRSGKAGVETAANFDRLSDFNVVPVSIGTCAPMSVFAMPLGFAMQPYLATEVFWTRHALVPVSTAGFGATSVALLAALGLVETVRWLCLVYL